MLQLPEWGGGSSPVVTEPPQIVLLWLLLLNGERIIIVRWTDLSDFFRRFSSVKCVFVVSRPMKIATFLLKKR